MAVYVVTGKLGAGKTLVAVGKIKDKLNHGCKVASNLDIRLNKLIGEKSRKACYYRIPDKPTLVDLEAIGSGNETYDESKNGLLVLDECGTWFNSRSWADKSRQAVINWFLHARKLGWDIIFLIQDLSIMDKQARVALAEHVVYCRRLDRVALPFIGALWSTFAKGKMPMPKIHMGIVRYGDTPTSLIVERWTYTGRNLYAAYDTKQSFSDSYEHATYQQLPPWFTHGVFRVPRDGRFYMKMTRIYWRRFNRPLLAAASFVLGAGVTFSVLLGDRVSTANEPPPVAEPAAVVDLSPYQSARIVSYAMLGDSIMYRFEGANHSRFSSLDLVRRGLSVSSVSACSASISNGVDNAQVSC